MTKGLLVLGVSLVVLGFLIFTTPRVKRLLVVGYIDRTGINVPLGILVITVGIVCMWVYYRQKKKEYKPRLLICPKCEMVRTSGQTETLTCANCGSNLEDLKGFYDRHPELKTAADIKKPRSD